MAIKYIDEIELTGKKIIARFDFNVPFAKDGSGKISDTTRIDSAMATINYILSKNPKKLILTSHLGRPKGGFQKEFSLAPVGEYLSSVLNEDVILTESCLDASIKTLLTLNESRVLLLENLRFHPEEEANDPEFSKKLASYADIYVNDAFGSAHRKHASTYGIVAYMPTGMSVGGFLLKEEAQALNKVSNHPEQPFISLVGGAKVSDKIKIIERLLTTSQKVLIGGAMAYPFLKAQGYSVGKSLCADEDVALAKTLLASTLKDKIILPIDHKGHETFTNDPAVTAIVIDTVAIPENLMALDIGPKTIKQYETILAGAKTVLWNGPMGLFENPVFAEGTFAMAKVLASIKAYTVVGGGDSVSALKKSKLTSQMGHVSTGGGASLEFIEQGTLPGINALKFGVN